MEWFAKRGAAVLVPDLLGTGETFPADYRGDAYIDGLSLNIWFAAVLVNKSIAGLRAEDISRLIQLMSDQFPGRDICAITKGEMAPVLLHAAVQDQRIQRIALIEPYVSYASIAMEMFFSAKYIPNMVPGAIQKYDLPDLEACLAPRRLMMLNTHNGAGEQLSNTAILNETSVVKRAYASKKPAIN